MIVKVTLEFSTAQEAAQYLAGGAAPEIPTVRDTPEPAEKRGRRRTKAEIEAAKAAEANVAATEPAPVPEPVEAAPEPEPAEVAGTVSKEELINRASEVLQKVGSAKFRELLGEYKIARLGELDPAAYGEFFGRMQQILGGSTEPKDDGADLI